MRVYYVDGVTRAYIILNTLFLLLTEQESVKVRDLEDTVATLRKLLGSREQEVHEITTQLRDLKDINKSLKKDLEHARARRTPTGPEDVSGTVH